MAYCHCQLPGITDWRNNCFGPGPVPRDSDGLRPWSCCAWGSRKCCHGRRAPFRHLPATILTSSWWAAVSVDGAVGERRLDQRPQAFRQLVLVEVGCLRPLAVRDGDLVAEAVR